MKCYFCIEQRKKSFYAPKKCSKKSKKKARITQRKFFGILHKQIYLKNSIFKKNVLFFSSSHARHKKKYFGRTATSKKVVICCLRTYVI